MSHSRHTFIGLSILLAAVHIVWIVGYSLPVTTDLFKALSPLLFAISAIVLFSFHRQFNRSFFRFIAIAFIILIISAIVLSQTGFVYNSFGFGPAIGIQLFGVPLIYPLFWINIIYSAGSITRRLQVVRFMKVVIATMMVLIMDLTIEPVAAKLEFWQWQNPGIPFLENIVTTSIAFIILLIFHLSRFRKTNMIAPVFYITTLLFFAYLNYMI
jgi:uncharacterized membrane protein